MKEITLTSIMNGAWKSRAIETCEERGIPHIIDGMKPVQRFLVAQGYKTAKTNFDKVSAIGGSIAALGYKHGDAAIDALTKMTAYYSNNLPLFVGDGSFGNVLNPTPAAGRYIFAHLTPLIDYIIKDTDLTEQHPDKEIKIPYCYLPIIPLCLINGIKGIATGFAVDIPPHDPISVIDELIRMCSGKEPRQIRPKYYNFSGSVVRDNNRYILTGTFERKSPIRILVTDLPPFNTSQSYESFLNKLVDKGTIASFENYSVDDKFRYDVVLKKGTRWTDEDIIKNLKLSSNHFWNITTVMPNETLKVWNEETGFEDIVKWFYQFRIAYIQKRIEKKRSELDTEYKYHNGFIKFLEDVVSSKLKLKDISEDELEKLILEKYKIPEQYCNSVMNTSVRNFTKEKIAQARENLDKCSEQIEYYKNTTKEIEYRNDLEELKKMIKKLSS